MSLLAWRLLYMWEAATPERSILFSASLCCCCVQFRTRLHCCMWIQSCRHVCACVCVCLCERVLLSVCRRGVVVAHCTVANLLCMWMRNSFPECVCFCVGENACVFLCEHVCVWVCVCVCDFALAVSEPSQLLENDFWHEAAAKTEQLRRQERNRVDGRGEGVTSHDTQ